MNAHLRNTGATLMWDVFDVFNMTGCLTQCARKGHNISPLEILSYHHYFSQLPKYAKLQWIVDYINTHSTHAMDVTFMISGKIVCQSLWMSTLGICTSLYFKAKNKASNGCIHVFKDIHRKPLERSNQAVAWMHNYFSLVGDYMPHRMVVHLPSNLSKLLVYHRMADEMKRRRHEQVVSQSQFFRLWDDNFSHVKIPKVYEIQ